jgi:hypothetical protein
MARLSLPGSGRMVAGKGGSKRIQGKEGGFGKRYDNMTKPKFLLKLWNSHRLLNSAGLNEGDG